MQRPAISSTAHSPTPLLALLYQMHIIEQSSVYIYIYIVRLGATDDNYFSISCLGRLPFARGWRWVEMTDGNRTKFNVSEYHCVNNYGVNVGNVSETIQMDLYFQPGCKYVKYLMLLCVQGVLILCLWIVPAFLYRVQGHLHMTLQSMCNVWIDEMWNMVGIEILLFFFFLTLLQRIQRHSDIRKTPDKAWWHMGFCDWDDCIRGRTRVRAD